MTMVSANPLPAGARTADAQLKKPGFVRPEALQGVAAWTRILKRMGVE